MEDVLIGLLAVAVGALFCFRGYLALRLVFPIWGAFVGFMFGAGLVSNVANQGFLRTLLSWIVAVVFALLFGLLAYLYYAVAVIIGMGAIGFTLGAGLMAVLGVQWSWLVILVGVTVGVALAVLSIMANVPMMLLVVLSALAGAALMVVGVMLMVGTLNSADFNQRATTANVEVAWWWVAAFGVLAVVGMVSQVRATDRLMASMRDEWSGSRSARTA